MSDTLEITGFAHTNGEVEFGTPSIVRNTVEFDNTGIISQTNEIVDSEFDAPSIVKTVLNEYADEIAAVFEPVAEPDYEEDKLPEPGQWEDASDIADDYRATIEQEGKLYFSLTGELVTFKDKEFRVCSKFTAEQALYARRRAKAWFNAELAIKKERDADMQVLINRAKNHLERIDYKISEDMKVFLETKIKRDDEGKIIGDKSYLTHEGRIGYRATSASIVIKDQQYVEACNWLEQNGYEGLLRTEIIEKDLLKTLGTESLPDCFEVIASEDKFYL